MHLNCVLLFKKYATEHFENIENVLEIGAAGYPSEFAKLTSVKNWHSLDIGDAFNSASNLNPLHITSMDEYHYPVANNTFDVVFASSVMEHVKEIWRWMDELTRITKPGGKIIIICPVSWIFHEAPVDCWRIYPEGMKALMHRSGLEVLLSKFESLEIDHLPPYYPTIPGVSTLPPSGNVSNVLKMKGKYNLIMSKIPVLKKFLIPVTVAYDTIAIAKKI